MKALIISADNFEDSELLGSCYRLKEAGVVDTNEEDEFIAAAKRQ